MNRKNDRLPTWWCVWLVLLWVGCGEPSDRKSLEGTVTLDGVPLAEGHVKFVPQRGTKGPIAGGKIIAGNFSISPEGGTFTGTFRVEITATRKTGKQVKDHRTGEMIDGIQQFLPPQYNRQSKLTATVTESGPNQYEFNMVSP